MMGLYPCGLCSFFMASEERGCYGLQGRSCAPRTGRNETLTEVLSTPFRDILRG